MSLTKNKIHRGDCIELLAQMDKGSVDLVFADPPFNIGYDYDEYDDARTADDYLKWCRQWMAGVRKCLKKDGTFWLAIGDEYAAELKITAQKLGFHCRSWVIWYYTFGVNCSRGFSRSHTHLFQFVKDRDSFTFNAANPKNRVPSARQLVYADSRANPSGRLPDNTWIYRPQDAPHAFQPDHDTWYFARVAGTFRERQGFHGCQMPEQLLGRIIRVSSQANELVLDPFAGSGTTAAVSKKLGRQWIGFELSKQYVSYINQRLRQCEIGDELDGAADPVASAPPTSRGKRRKMAADAEMEEGVIEAFRKSSDGYSADYLLCHPDLGSHFLKTCKELSVPGNAILWNQQMLKLRKSKRLPKSTRKIPRVTFEQMDAYSHGAEIALQLVMVDQGVTVDSMLCAPDVVAEFDRIAREFAPGFSALDYRWAALAIRKRANQARKLALGKYAGWSSCELPDRIPLKNVDPEELKIAGVYVLYSGEIPVYVGETEDISARVDSLRSNDNWENLGPDSLMTLPAVQFKASEKHAVQAALCRRLRSVLNTQLVVHEG
ncbi:MAG: DNA methyltransferase [Planctomycetota bacterium]|nr:DNA methyltransferase [Planctomycetota bacterium]